MWKRTGETRVDSWAFGAPLLVLLLLSALAFGGCKTAHGGWGAQGCAPVGAPAYASFQWHYPADWQESGRADLYRSSIYLGSYDYFTGRYQPADGSNSYTPKGYPVWPARVVKLDCLCSRCGGDCRCGSKGICCGAPNCKCCDMTTGAITYNGGIVVDRVGKQGSPRYTLHGEAGARELSRQEAHRAVVKGLDDDSAKPYLVAVCVKSELRAKVFGDLYSSPALALVREHTRLQVYSDPKHHHLEAYKLEQDERFKRSGLMIALVGAPDKEGFGKRLYAQYDYDGGPERLGYEAKRRIDPNFDPNKDTTPKPPSPAPVPTPVAPNVDLLALLGQLLMALPGWSYIVASIGAALLILRGGK